MIKNCPSCNKKIPLPKDLSSQICCNWKFGICEYLGGERDVCTIDFKNKELSFSFHFLSTNVISFNGKYALIDNEIFNVLFSLIKYPADIRAIKNKFKLYLLLI